ncbi:YhdP family protein [Luteimonas qiangzhengi]|uniref:YhdP family protein n=1 Tax=Luteimonas sp. MJ146 TaxID=3129240 RepID=UPI0031BBA8BA
MNAAARTGLRITRRTLWYALATVLVLMALGAVAASRLLPALEQNPQRVAQWLTDRSGHPVAFDDLQAEWTRRGPVLQLRGLQVGQGDGAVTVGEAEVLVAQYSGLLPGRSLTELRLRNLDLTLERDPDGRWHVRGLPGQDGGGDDPFAALERLGELQVIDASLTVDAPDLALRARLPHIDLRLRVNGSRVRAASRARISADGAPLMATARFDRNSGNGRLHASVDGDNLDDWSPLLQLAGVRLEQGQGRIQAWADLDDARVGSVMARAALEDVALAASADSPAPVRIGFEQLDAQFQWRQTNDGWRVDVPELRVQRGGQEWLSTGLAARIGSDFALAADRIEAAPLLQILALSDRPAPEVRAWLERSGANAVLTDVELAGVRDGPLRARAQVETLAFDPVGEQPGLAGLRGELVADARGLVFTFDPEARVQFDWPSGFGQAHLVTLTGEVAAWLEDDGWRVQTPALRLVGDGYGADVRGGLAFQGDGSRPRIDLAARVDEARIPVASKFWVRHKMSEQTLAWLDAALVEGRVRNGRAVLSGDLDDWPFDADSGPAGAGLFHAEAELVDATLAFQPDWPAAERLQGQLRFIGAGFDFRGTGAIADVAVEQVEAGIPEFGRAELAITATAAPDTDIGDAIAMLQRSPLAVEALEGLQTEGPLRADFAMLLPLHGDGAGLQIEGRAGLGGVEAAIPEWAVDFQDLRGELTYNQHGFQARSLSARVDGHPGRLALRAGSGHVVDATALFEGEFSSALDAPRLLARAPQLDWLRPHLHGRSAWRVAVTVPGNNAEATAARLTLASDLVGTTLDLPAPLAKSAVVALPARVAIPLPLGSGDVEVQLGERMSLRAHAGEGPPAVSVSMGGAAAGAPSAGLVVKGRTPELDALEWAALVGGGGSGETDGLALAGMDLRVDRLQLAGGGFGSVHVRAVEDQEGTRLEFDGEAIAGTLTLPAGESTALAGHFPRLHWRRPNGEGPVAGQADVVEKADAVEEAVVAGEGPDPSRIPPIRLSVEDLRVEQAQLGTATLITSRTSSGMRIEQVEAQSPVHHIVASGEWTGRGGAAHTRMEMRVASANFGQLLDGLGYHGHVNGADGRVQLAAAWPASPAGFKAELLDGTLDVRLSDGQLLEVQPGAGRLLGLLSIAELPRRLSLDFRDFFAKGFAFNRIEGAVQVVAGQARSESLVMDGPAARIQISGQADLRARTYDQTVEVLPKSGNVLAAVGAITAGPVGAAVGAMANAVLRRPLSELGSTTYRIRGPWSEPEVEVVRREAPRVAERERPPPQQ